MKLFECFFNPEGEIRSRFFSDRVPSGACPYLRESSGEYSYINSEELEDEFSSFFQIFQEDEEGDELLDVILRDWCLFRAPVSEEEGFKNFFDDLMAELDLRFRSNSRVRYIDEIQSCKDTWYEVRSCLIEERRYTLNRKIDLNEIGWDVLLNSQITIDEKKKLYRARIHEEGQEGVYEIEEMGAPSRELCIGGRANPAGIPFLYLSREKETTVYEVRGLPYDRLSIGTFSPVRKLGIVDLTNPQAMFGGDTREYMTLCRRLLLIKLIADEMSRPMRRYSKPIEYVPTQFVCEYIRYVVGADGVQFTSSIYRKGVNIVIFDPNSCRCTNVEPYHVSSHNLEIQRY